MWNLVPITSEQSLCGFLQNVLEAKRLEMESFSLVKLALELHPGKTRAQTVENAQLHLYQTFFRRCTCESETHAALLHR